MSGPLSIREAQVLWVANGDCEGAVKPGNFYEKVIEAAFHADPENLKLIEKVFPDVVEALRRWRSGAMRKQLVDAGIDLDVTAECAARRREEAAS